MGMNSQGHSLAFCRINTLSCHDLQHEWSIIFVSVANCISSKKRGFLASCQHLEISKYGAILEKITFFRWRWYALIRYDSRKAADGKTFVARFIGKAVAISTSSHPPKTTNKIVGQGKVKLVP